MKKQQRVVIPFTGLKEGIHHFEFEINSEFFEQFDFSIIHQASFMVNVEFEKRSNLFNLVFKLKGEIDSSCDRCMDAIKIPVEGVEELIVKFGEDNYTETDEIKIVSPNEHELDLSNEVYQYCHLLLPSKIQHEKEEDCNREIIEKLEEFTFKRENDTHDPRWSALSKLKDRSE